MLMVIYLFDRNGWKAPKTYIFPPLLNIPRRNDLVYHYFFECRIILIHRSRRTFTFCHSLRILMLERYNFGCVTICFFPFHFDSDNMVTIQKKIQKIKSIYNVFIFFRIYKKWPKNIFADMFQNIFSTN